ncbi:hypothetical protein H8356DRAFT_1434641 [Neocallimastix lanati (nom. inval.)]|nr:hypothetical protein H8356DRAFT_1434641 [Neocallimastix sp. JGI-2020a]
MAIQLLINCKLRRSQSSLHTARRCIPNVPTYISNDHEHQNGTINSSLVGVIIGDWKFYNHQGLCFNSKRSIRVGETKRGKEQVIINRKFKFNFSNLKKNNSIYKCTECDASISITKYRVKEEIRKSSTPFDIKLERIFNEISKEVGRHFKQNYLYNTIINIFEDGTFKIVPKGGYQVTKNLRSVIITSKIIHCDFEKGISNAAKKKVFPDLNIKYLYLKFPFINPEYINDINNKIKQYFEITYLKDYEIKYWNCYDNIEHSLFYDDYKMRKSGAWEKKLRRTDEINALIKYYKNMEIPLKKEKKKKKKRKRKRSEFIELWLNCLRDLNIKIIN